MARWWCVGLMMLVLAGCESKVPVPAETTAADTTVDLGAPTAEPSLTTKSEKVASTDPTVVPTLELATTAGTNTLSEEEITTGWLKLFDGHTLFGWQPNSKTEWTVKDGIIMASGDTPGLLCTTTRWADYELKVDFRIAEGGNSGIFLRTTLNPTDPAVDCYELNICDSHPQFKSASLVKRAQPSKEVTANGDWHNFTIRHVGNELAVKMDGEDVLQFTDTTEKPLMSGFIGLQMNGGQAEFRNIYLRPLGMTALFDGKTLDGWRVVPGSRGEFTVKDGTIQVTGDKESGRGFLETELTAGNFVFQFEAITHGDALNSGVFFRALPGTEKNPSDGYEFQIQNGIKNNDRNQPADHGTGAIFRRASARRVVSDDRQWLAATLVADGPHFTTWVNGIQVVDWTDDRALNENPRQGLRLEPGHFSLQAHDPTTDLQFREIQLAPLP